MRRISCATHHSESRDLHGHTGGWVCVGGCGCGCGCRGGYVWVDLSLHRQLERRVMEASGSLWADGPRGGVVPCVRLAQVVNPTQTGGRGLDDPVGVELVAAWSARPMRLPTVLASVRFALAQCVVGVGVGVSPQPLPPPLSPGRPPPPPSPPLKTSPQQLNLPPLNPYLTDGTGVHTHRRHWHVTLRRYRAETIIGTAGAAYLRPDFGGSWTQPRSRLGRFCRVSGASTSRPDCCFRPVVPTTQSEKIHNTDGTGVPHTDNTDGTATPTCRCHPRVGVSPQPPPPPLSPGRPPPPPSPPLKTSPLQLNLPPLNPYARPSPHRHHHNHKCPSAMGSGRGWVHASIATVGVSAHPYLPLPSQGGVVEEGLKDGDQCNLLVAHDLHGHLHDPAEDPLVASDAHPGEHVVSQSERHHLFVVLWVGM